MRLVPFVLLLTSACSSVEFAETAYQPLCWEANTRCVKVLDLEGALQSYLDETQLPITDLAIQRWDRSVAARDGVFEFVGTRGLSRDEKRSGLEYLVANRALVEELEGVADEELRALAPEVFARNDASQLARVRIAIAPFLQRTNGSVAVANGDQVVVLFGVDRMAFNVTDRGFTRTWVKSVVAHELIHASHFASSEFATSARADPRMLRSLWVEGLATWGSANHTSRRYSLEQVFRGDYARQCEAHGVEWSRRYLAELDDDSAFEAWWRESAREPRGGVMTAGYCVAYRMLEVAMSGQTFEGLLSLKPVDAYAAARSALALAAQ
ncbi:MAG: hypothetical protein MUC96_18175 [Myxococcaceae bacterium]|jgi:hypothetical protein|nr:hypothetical protein [Myxococcaceae bacterium]